MLNISNKIKILVVEDDIAQYALIEAYLETQSFLVKNVTCIREFELIINTISVDIIILDLILPDGDGLNLVKKICLELKIPLIIVSSKNTSMDRILGLELGADDYISKPYHPRELLVRVKKVLNRKIAEQKSTYCEVAIGEFNLNDDDKCLYNKNRDVMPLTRGEYSIIKTLAKANGKVVSRSQLIKTVFSRIESSSDRSVDVLISRIRQKLETEVIETVKGFGYRIKKTVNT